VWRDIVSRVEKMSEEEFRRMKEKKRYG